MFDILSVIPGKKKATGSGWWSMNAVCCSHRGHRQDKRARGGIKFDGPHTWHYHCFNCGFTCGFSLGSRVPYKTRQLLEWSGIDREQIQKWSLESLQQRGILEYIAPKPKNYRVEFPTVDLPDDVELLDSENPEHKRFIEYINSRGLDHSDYPYMVTPYAESRYRNRIIIPYTYKDKLVGYTSRFLDGKSPKYLNVQQPGYVFGMDLQKPTWQVCIVTEGIFDALSIDGCALMHETISIEQARMIASLNRRIIVVPDYDKSGLPITERALELGYSVSMPNWGKGVKDVNDAVQKFGKLATTLAILENATTSRIKIEMRKKQIIK